MINPFKIGDAVRTTSQAPLTTSIKGAVRPSVGEIGWVREIWDRTLEPLIYVTFASGAGNNIQHSLGAGWYMRLHEIELLETSDDPV